MHLTFTIFISYTYIHPQASESGTSNSVTSAEDLQKLAVILGLNSAEDVYQERFRVDRRRLETMLAGKQNIILYKLLKLLMYALLMSIFSDNLEESQTAQAFFHRVSFHLVII